MLLEAHLPGISPKVLDCSNAMSYVSSAPPSPVGKLKGLRPGELFTWRKSNRMTGAVHISLTPSSFTPRMPLLTASTHQGTDKLQERRLQLIDRIHFHTRTHTHEHMYTYTDTHRSPIHTQWTQIRLLQLQFRDHCLATAESRIQEWSYICNTSTQMTCDVWCMYVHTHNTYMYVHMYIHTTWTKACVYCTYCCSSP